MRQFTFDQLVFAFVSTLVLIGFLFPIWGIGGIIVGFEPEGDIRMPVVLVWSLAFLIGAPYGLLSDAVHAHAPASPHQYIGHRRPLR